MISSVHYLQAIVQGLKGWDFLVSWVMYTINARKRRRLRRKSRKKEKTIAEKDDWEEDAVIPEPDTFLCFSNHVKIESGLSNIRGYQHTSYSELLAEKKVGRNEERYFQERNNDGQVVDQTRTALACYNEINRDFHSHCDFHFSNRDTSGKYWDKGEQQRTTLLDQESFSPRQDSFLAELQSFSSRQDSFSPRHVPFFPHMILERNGIIKNNENLGFSRSSYSTDV